MTPTWNSWAQESLAGSPFSVPEGIELHFDPIKDDDLIDRWQNEGGFSRPPHPWRIAAAGKRGPLPYHPKLILAWGTSWWDWQAGVTLAFYLDFDYGHGPHGLDDAGIRLVDEWAAKLDCVMSTTSRGGEGRHWLVFLEIPLPANSREEHARNCLAGRDRLSAILGVDLSKSVCAAPGAIQYLWHSQPAPDGLKLLKLATGRLAVDPPPPEPVQPSAPSAPQSAPQFTSSAPQKHPAVEAYNRESCDFSILRKFGWTGLTRPGGTKLSASICKAKDGTALLHIFSTNAQPFEAEHNYSPFDVFRILQHGGNAEEAIVDLVKQGFGHRVRLLTCGELDAKDCDNKFLIKGIWVEKQPGTLGGGKKTLKTCTAQDMAVSLATGLPFLGRFPIVRPCGVIMLSGESGEGTLKETFRRICKTKGTNFSKIKNLWLSSEWLPRFNRLEDLATLELFLQETKAELLIVDPTYFCMDGAGAGNIFIQGETLRPIKEICQKYGVSLVLVHHMRKRSKGDSVYGNPDLDNLAWAGFAEFSRQWILLERREAYEPGTGIHKLLMDVGGSVGHQARWAVDIDEGTDYENRLWNVTIQSPDAARKKKKAGTDRDRILAALSQFPQGNTKSCICTLAGLHSDTITKIILDALVDEGLVVSCKVTKNGVGYDGYKLADKPTR